MERGNTRLRPGSWSAAHPNEGDDERWKGSPTKESTGDSGSNARVASQHQQSENQPASRRQGRPRAPAAGRRPTRH